MTTPRTPMRALDAIPRPEGDLDITLERGFVASLRWLVAEGDARGVRRIAVELRAHLILLELVTREDRNATWVEVVQRVTSERLAEGPGASRNQDRGIAQL